MNTTETLLEIEIREEFEALKSIDVGSDVYKTTVDGITKLVDRQIELEKIKNEQEDKSTDRDLKTEQFEDEKRDRWIRNGIALAGVVLPIVFGIWGAQKSWEFEKTGTITTTMGRLFMGKLIPKK